MSSYREPINLSTTRNIMKYVDNQDGRHTRAEDLNESGEEREQQLLQYHFDVLGSYGLVNHTTTSGISKSGTVIRSLTKQGRVFLKMTDNKEVMNAVLSKFGQKIRGDQLESIQRYGAEVLVEQKEELKQSKAGFSGFTILSEPAGKYETQKSYRLGEVSRKLNVSQSLIRNFLRSKNIKIEENPEAKFITQIIFDELSVLITKRVVSEINNPLQLALLNSDSVHKGKDLLGFKQDVEAFAAIMALNELTPPLAIALFGEWGTGKSFFMQKLSEKVEELSKNQGFLRSEEEDDEELEPEINKEDKPFCQGICQIHFNAWSYIDTNLWASLVTQIFEQLDNYINQNRSDAEKEKDSIKSGIAEQLDIAKGQVAELEARKAQVQNSINALNEQVRIAQGELDSKVKAIISFNRQGKIHDAITNSGIKASLKDVLNKAGINPSQLEEINPDLILTELKSGQTFIRQLLKFSGWDLGWVALGVILVVLTVFILPEVESLGVFELELVSKAMGVLAVVFSKVRGTLSKLTPLVNGVLKIKDNYDKAINRAISEHEQEVLGKQIEANQKEVELNQLKLQLKAKEAEIKEIEYKPDSVLAQKAMYSFITRKAASKDYSRHLGIISMIRKDFQTLSELFVESKKADKVNEKDLDRYTKFDEIRSQFKKPLERIVLYIDDLDRCSEERVVEVLEAVNLLMAFPLFVVVVGVDPRWVKNALIKKYYLQFTGRIKGADSKVESSRTEIIDPIDYLEKIFQIPFHLKAPEDESIKSMITYLLGNAILERKEGRADEKPIDEGQSPVLDDLHSLSHEKNMPAEVSAYEEGAEKTTEEKNSFDQGLENDFLREIKVVTPKSLKLHWEEGEYMRDLSWLIGNTPRTVKRFVNMYRIVRAHEGLSYENADDREELFSLIFILALRTGVYQDISDKILSVICHSGTQTVKNAVKNCKTRLNDDVDHELEQNRIRKKNGTFVSEITNPKLVYDSRYYEILNKLESGNELELMRERRAQDLLKQLEFVKRFSFKRAI